MTPIPPTSRVTVERGFLHVDGKPRYFLNTDYPYYRDDVDNWRPRLQAQKDAGLDILTSYVPWRHHAPQDPLHGGGAYDFTGDTQPNRDLVGLLAIAEDVGLKVILKPGPFVHAELPFGGLPTYVCAECNPRSGIQPEIDAYGKPARWRIGRMNPQDAHLLPGPFDAAYNVYVRSFFREFARKVAAPHYFPRGPIIAFQLLNEGIYCDSSRADPTQFAFAPSTLVRFRHFLHARYGDIATYNDLHLTTVADWDEIEPPRLPGALSCVRDLLRYLDWSAFQGRIYPDVATLYKSYLIEGGLPADAPMIFNFNPNGDTYRQWPASNDGWYTRVNLMGRQDFTFGSTNWLGVVAGSARTFRQYVMSLTAFRGPAMEMNWGFASENYTPYALVAPSVYEAMVAVAAGATGITAYTFAGTRAWREDRNLRVKWIHERTNDREDESCADYPGDAPVLSTGTRTGKFWSLMQLSQLLADEGPRFLVAGPHAPITWGIYPPYAWAGQWLVRGDADDIVWRPPLRAVPRGAYHGLDAFAEMALSHAVSFTQTDVTRGPLGLEQDHPLCVSAYEFMDLPTQRRLADHVEHGGSLLLTNVVPNLDETLRAARGALSDVFPHQVDSTRVLRVPAPVIIEGEVAGLVQGPVEVVHAPADADMHITLRGETVGYRRKHGRGTAIFLGVNPWRAVLSGDDRAIARECQRLVWRLLRALDADIPDDAPSGGQLEGGIVVIRHGVHGVTGGSMVFVIVGDAAGDVRVPGSDSEGGEMMIRSPSLSVHAAGIDAEGLRVCYLKGINDMRGERVAPRLETRHGVIEALTPCDLCVTRVDGDVRVSVAHTETESTRVRLPYLVSRFTEARDALGDSVPFAAVDGGIEILMPAIEQRGIVTLRGQTLAEHAPHEDRVSNPG